MMEVRVGLTIVCIKIFTLLYVRLSPIIIFCEKIAAGKRARLEGMMRKTGVFSSRLQADPCSARVCEHFTN